MGNTACFKHIPLEILNAVGPASLTKLKRYLDTTSINNLHFADNNTAFSFHQCFKHKDEMIFVNPYGVPFVPCKKTIQKKHYSFYYAVFTQGSNEGTIHLVLCNKFKKNP